METPFSRWYAAIPHRMSRRSFRADALEAGVVEHIRAFCREFRPFPQARAELVTELPQRVFKAGLGPYGRISGAPAYIAFVGRADDPYVNEKVGYTGEGIVLEATAMGLGTCWVGGWFDRRVATSAAGASKDERIMAVTPIGYTPEALSRNERIMRGTIRAHRRKPLRELVAGLAEAEWPGWMRSALEAARLAPSAYNRQPWRFYVEPRSITVSVDTLRFNLSCSRRLDCGIAMLHIEAAAADCGMRGEWEFLQPPQVARFRVAGSE